MIEVMWQPPETPNGILTGYEVTVYNTRLNYTHTVSVGPSVLNITISDNIGKKHFMILLMHAKYAVCFEVVEVVTDVGAPERRSMIMLFTK